MVRAYYEAFNAGDCDAMLALLTEDVAHDINQGECETGKEAFRRFLAQMDHCYLERLTDIVVMVSADGSRAAAEFVVHGTYRATGEGLPPARGQTYALPAGAFFNMRHGLISRVTTYYNLADWRAQVGTQP
ncbi:MAG: ketosteroid isomerase-related protein [Geminicoccaceae bacterium]